MIFLYSNHIFLSSLSFSEDLNINFIEQIMLSFSIVENFMV